MIDRIFLGYVVDFVDFTLINFAVFNAADACVSIGAVLLCVYVLFFSEKQDNGKAKEPLKATADKKNEKEKNEDDAAVIVTENINENIRSSAEEKSEPQNEEGEAN